MFWYSLADFLFSITDTFAFSIKTLPFHSIFHLVWFAGWVKKLCECLFTNFNAIENQWDLHQLQYQTSNTLSNTNITCQWNYPGYGSRLVSRRYHSSMPLFHILFYYLSMTHNAYHLIQSWYDIIEIFMVCECMRNGLWNMAIHH